MPVFAGCQNLAIEISHDASSDIGASKHTALSRKIFHFARLIVDAEHLTRQIDIGHVFFNERINARI